MILIKYHNDPFSIFLKKLWGNISAKFRRNWLKVVAPGKSNIWGLEHTWTAVVPDLQITYSKNKEGQKEDLMKVRKINQRGKKYEINICNLTSYNLETQYMISHYF